MTVEQTPEESYVLSWSDLKVVLTRSKRKILCGALLCALLAAFLTLSREVTYTAQGTFREKSKQQNSSEKTLSSLLMSGGATAAESMAITTIKSRRVLEKVVLDLNLQGTVKKKNERNFLAEKIGHYLSNIYNNLVVQEAYFSKKYKVVVNDPHQELVATNIAYDGELSTAYELRFFNATQFKIYDAKELLVGSGKLNEPVQLTNASFTVEKLSRNALEDQTYIVSLSPKHRVAQNLLGNLVVEADKLDKTLLKINYTDDNRHHSSRFLNKVMDTYRDFLVDEHVRVTIEQVAYLKKRQEDMDKQLVLLMEDHAVNIASNDASIEFLVKTQQNYKSKLLNFDLETKHLEKAQAEGIAFFERHSADGDSPVVQNLLGDIRKYRQQADTLELALRNKHVYSREVQELAFNQYIEELQETYVARHEAKQLLAQIQKGEVSPGPADALVGNPKYLVKPWHDKLVQSDKARTDAKTDAEKQTTDDEFSRAQDNYALYLANLLHLFEVQEKTTQDRLTHQQNPQVEFQGIDLETANGLYVTYSRELHSLEADLAQKEFIIQQLNQPEFEVSSINSIMEDSISREIITKTSSLMLVLKDEPNRTTKELERLKRDVEIQKGFLIVHLKQMCDILRLREQLLEDKIHSLQNVTLELVRQKISIQEKHLADYINSRLNNLKHEKEVITQHQEELQKELDLLPEKWASQKLIDQHMQSNLNTVQQIASLIETKTIGENLEVSQSAPFDEAVIPVLPRDPRVLLFASIGAFGGAFLTFCFCLVNSAASGVEATPENLQAIRQKVAGRLSHEGNFSNIDDLNEDDLETLRRLIIQLSSNEAEQPQRIVLIEGLGVHYAEVFAALIAKRGIKVLLLPLTFNEEAPANELPGLLDVLEGRAPEPKIIKGLYFDRVAAGGVSYFANELIESKLFAPLLDRLSAEYPVVVGYTYTAALSAEAESLLHLFSSAAISLSGEHIDELKSYFAASRSHINVSFVFHDEN